MKRTSLLKPTLRKYKDGKAVRFSAAMAGIEAYDYATKPGAIEGCESRVISALQRLQEGTRFYRFMDRIYALVPDDQGWGYWVEDSEGKDSERPRSFGYRSRQDAERTALISIAQQSWEPYHSTWTDASFLEECPIAIRSELASWIGFQRRYLEAKSKGYGDNDCHRIAGGLEPIEAPASSC